MMPSGNRPHPVLWLAALLVAGLIGWMFWHWEVERVEVPSGHFLVRVHLWGTNLKEDEILAPDESYKGIMLDVLPEGRHFINPLIWRYEVKPVLQVPVGKCGVLTRKFGKVMSPEQLAITGNPLAGEGERGIVAKVLQPGTHRVNPYAYDVQLVDAVEIRAEQVGVRVLKIGKDPAPLFEDPKQSRYVVPSGYRGVQDQPVSAATYYLNPFVEEIIPVEVRSHRVEFSDIEFPSKDGFLLKPHVLVTYRVIAEKAPELYVVLSDEGKVNQADSSPQEMAQNQILQKIVLPLIRGIVRIEGSKYDARDFVSAEAGTKVENPRQKLQATLVEKVAPKCQAAGVAIESITLAEMEAPPDLTEQISLRELARVEREKNLDKVKQFKTEQELQAKATLEQQGTQKVSAETRLKQATVLATQKLAVEELRLEQELANAQLRLDAARKQAEATLAKGEAEAKVIELQNEAEISGLRRAVEGFPSVTEFAQYHIMARLGPALSEIFASDDSDFARLFAGLMAPTRSTTPSAPPVTAALPKAQ